MELWFAVFFIAIMVIGAVLGFALLLYWIVKMLFSVAGDLYDELRSNYERNKQ